MSIRIKLMITYAVLVLVSAVVIIFSGISLFTMAMTEISDAVLQDVPVERMFTEVVDLLADLKQAEKYEPDQLIEPSYVNDISSHLDFTKGGVVVKYSDQVIVSDNLSADKIIIDKLEKSSEYRKHDNYVTSGDIEYAFMDYVFTVDNKEVVYFFLIDVSQLGDVEATVGRQSFRAFIMVLLIVMLPILWIITRDIIKPLNQLSKGVDNITKGDLDFQLTTKKRNEIGSVIKSFETMRAHLKDSLEKQVKFEENRKELITSISHDLKTPITSIKGHVEGIRDGVANSPEKLEKYLDVIYQKSQDMDQLIDDLFLFSKLDLNKVPFELKQVPIKEFVAEIVQEMSFEFDKDNEHIQMQSHISDDTLVNLDVVQMKRVLVNIIQNSMKYMDKDQKKIDVTLNDLKSSVQIVITDNGQGISEDHLEFIFDRFYRVDESRNPETGGTGLGLAISKQIVIQHGGRIQAYSKLNHGTKMVIELNKEVKND
ncbi:HAMP domain-containing histidine kinase [Acidaminobacter sp. JC074]|uniref:sensor histidine kinase n=1 Tax=Acidaminobacter sp. JC074 TaxID=2530199 RepID=UPI001F0F60AD|nr:HAMP domain-containing sensor histidine kinase [Acidaminobacter sp. JC074]MCH4889253.1 HAMP domain-containing histidine kinase [Acidaminobacter sp. JC074]